MTLLFRGWLIVTLTALNVSQIASGRFLGAFFCGTAISLVWYLNAGQASSDRSKRATLLYGLGAGVGTVTGMWLGRML